MIPAVDEKYGLRTLLGAAALLLSLLCVPASGVQGPVMAAGAAPRL